MERKWRRLFSSSRLVSSIKSDFARDVGVGDDSRTRATLTRVQTGNGRTFLQERSGEGDVPPCASYVARVAEWRRPDVIKTSGDNQWLLLHPGTCCARCVFLSAVAAYQIVNRFLFVLERFEALLETRATACGSRHQKASWMRE